VIGVASSPGDSVDDAVARQLVLHHLPGLSLAVFDHGKIVKAQGYGVASRASGNPVTPETLFQAGSVSKPVSAVGILQRVEAGQLTLDTDINQYLKSWKLPSNALTKATNVTVRQLLSHSAGTTVHGFAGYETGAPLPTVVDVLNGAGPANNRPIVVDLEPGLLWRYSGGGYVVLLEAFVDVTGRPFPDYMTEHVLKPWGMTESTFEQPLPSDRRASAATGHDVTGRPVAGGSHVYPELTAAGLWTTPSDLARFALGLEAAYAGRSSVLSQATARAMLTVQIGQWGLGIALRGTGHTRKFWHNGRNDGFDTFLVGSVEMGQGAAIMINRNDNSPAMMHVLDAIAAAYGWADFQAYRPPEPIRDANPALTSELSGILVAMGKGEFEPSLFSPALCDMLSKKLKDGSSFRTEYAGNGAFRSLEALHSTDRGSTIRYFYRAHFENLNVLLELSIQEDGKIGALTLNPE
jgi:CubicO group peptidase (beta-lactamase class C family)